MKKYLIAVISAAFIIIMASGCNNATNVGPTGPEGTNLMMMYFQDGLYPSTSYFGTENNYLLSSSPDSNDNSSSSFWAGYYTPDAKERVILFFDIYGYLPANAKVEKAYLVLYCDDTDGAGSPSLALYGITSDWDTSAATWNSSMTSTLWASAGGDYNSTSVSDTLTVSTLGYKQWEIKASVVQGWLDGINYGMMLKSTNETILEDASFITNTGTTPEQRPRLVVYYSII